VGPHAIGDHKKMAARLKEFGGVGCQQRMRILIRRTTHAYVG
jgi:hypothetical protein